MSIFQRLFKKTKEKIEPLIPRKLNSREEWCKNFIESGRSKSHDDIGKMVWTKIYDLDNNRYHKRKCKILAYRVSLEVDGTDYKMMVKDETGMYDAINLGSYFYNEPDNWAWDLDYWNRKTYIQRQHELIALKRNSRPIPTDKQTIDILKKEDSIRRLKPILTKAELREKRLNKILNK